MANPPIPNAIPADWSRLAATSPGSVLFRTSRPDADQPESGSRNSFLFTNPLQILSASQLHEIPAIFRSIDEALQSGHYVAGFLSYEAGYHFEPAAKRSSDPLAPSDVPLAWFGVYRQPLIRNDHETPPPTLQIDDPPAAESEEVSVNISPAEYHARIQQIRRYIEAGDLYQANFTLMLRQAFHGDAAALFERMMENQPVSYGALIHTGQTHILSASPELFFRKHGSRIVVRPMKGTSPRGRDLAEDAQKAAWLARDEKNRAENLMIVDLLRNDLGRICRPGSIKVTDLFAVERYSGMLQMTSTVRGELQPGTSHYQLFRSLFPCGSITGAPKIRTMQVIRELEQQSRGIACGAIGYFSPSGDAVFSVAIRTLTLRNGQARLRVGSGITYDSDPEAEYAECLLKSRFFTRIPMRFELIETLRWSNGFFLLDLHLQRLKDSATYFEFAFDPEIARAQLNEHAEDFPRNSRHRVRLLLSRSGAISITSEPFTDNRNPASLLIATERTDSSDLLLRHKTTRRAVYDHALADARAKGFDDALFLNVRGEVTECAIHNVMIATGGKLVTPPLACGVLPGTYRQHLLATHPEIHEAVITLDDILAADRILIFNSVRGLRRARLSSPITPTPAYAPNPPQP